MYNPRLKLEYGFNRGSFLYDQISKEMIGMIGTKKMGAQVLAEVVSRVPSGIHVEIGTQWGGTAILAGLLQESDGRVYCIDPVSKNKYYGGLDPYTHLYPHAKYLKANIKRFGLQERVIHIDKPSHPWPYPGQCDTAFIDGDHSFPVVGYDWMNLRERCTRYIVFDNIEDEFPAVQDVFDMACNDKRWRLAALVGEVGVVERVG